MSLQGPETVVAQQLLDIYSLLEATFGDLGWWPAQTRAEIMVGAILVQSVSWSNTVKALDNLRDRDLLDFHHLYLADHAVIEDCVKSSRFYKSKTKKLKAMSQHVVERYNNSLDAFLGQPMETLRNELLSIHGIGPETADAIVLYAAGLPSFVVDAYTKRIFSRLGLIDEGVGYTELRAWFMNHLPHNVRLYNQYHALLDGAGHAFCSAAKPKCNPCPLKGQCRFYITEPHNRHQSRPLDR